MKLRKSLFLYSLFTAQIPLQIIFVIYATKFPEQKNIAQNTKISAKDIAMIEKFNNLSSANRNAVLVLLDSLYEQDFSTEKQKFHIIKNND